MKKPWQYWVRYVWHVISFAKKWRNRAMDGEWNDIWVTYWDAKESARYYGGEYSKCIQYDPKAIEINNVEHL